MAQTGVVAEIAANADGTSTAGWIQHERMSFSVVVDGMNVGGARNLQVAAERLAHELRSKLPRKATSWGVSAKCSSVPIAVVFGNLAGGGGSGGLHPCASHALRGLRFTSLEQALQGAARLIGHCCN